MQFNQRKREALGILGAWMRPDVYAVAVGFFPTRAAWSYLKHLQRWGLLLRGRDITGRLVYKLSPRGARWLLRNRE